MIPFYCNSARSSSCSFWGRSLLRRPLASPLCFCEYSFFFFSISRAPAVPLPACTVPCFSHLRDLRAYCSQRPLQITRIALSDPEFGAWRRTALNTEPSSSPFPLRLGMIGFCSRHVNFLKVIYPCRTHTAIRMVELHLWGHRSVRRKRCSHSTITNRVHCIKLMGPYYRGLPQQPSSV